MILSFSKDSFVEGFLNGDKIHTFRKDPKRRWKVGMTIHAWKGSPRNPKSNPYQFTTGECKWTMEAIIRNVPEDISRTGFTVTLNGMTYSGSGAEIIAKNDGLTVEEFKAWFLSEEDEVEARLIGWGDCPYDAGYNGFMSFLKFSQEEIDKKKQQESQARAEQAHYESEQYTQSQAGFEAGQHQQ